MIFRPDAAQLVLEGRKTQTRRPVGAFAVCRYVEGRTYAVQPGRGRSSLGRILILATSLEPVRTISDGDAWAEGFSTVEGFFERWRELHGEVRGHCWRIEFRLDSVLPAV